EFVAHLFVQRIGGPWSCELATDEQRLCNVPGLTAGVYEVKLTSMDTQNLRQEAARPHYVTVPAKTAVDVNVLLDKSAVRHVRVHVPDGNHIWSTSLYYTGGDPIRV